MADRDLNSPEEVYPNSRWVPCTSNLVCHGSSGSPEKDGIENLQKFFHPSKRRKYRSYLSVASIKDLIEDLVFGTEMSPYPPLPLPKSKKQIKEERIEERMGKLAQKIRNYHAERYNIPNATQNPNNTLFVARLSYESTTEALVNEFRFFGQILEVKLVTNREGRSRGYAFIEFMDEESLKKTLTSSKKKVIDGREVLLDYERRRLEIGWLPRRLGGGLGVKPKRPKKSKKKEKAKAHEASVTSTPNTESSSQNNQNQAAVNISKELETMSMVEEGSQKKITVKNVKKKKNSAREVSVEPSESSVESSKSTNGSADFSGRAASTFDHQSSTGLPQNYVEEIPAASYVQYQQPNQYSLPQPNQMCYPVFISSQPPQSNGYNSYIVQENSYAPPINYIPPVSGIISQSYSNFSYPQVIPAHQFDPQLGQNFGAQSQNYQVQLPNHLVLQPANHNISYLAPNWQPTSQMPSLPPQNYQAPPVFYPVQQPVVQNSSQMYQNYSGEPGNHHVQQFNHSIPYAAYENYNVSAVPNEAPQIDHNR